MTIFVSREKTGASKLTSRRLQVERNNDDCRAVQPLLRRNDAVVKSGPTDATRAFC
jgi:hypothetical protein